MARQRMPPPMADLPASRCMSVRVCVRTCVRKHSASPLSERARDRGNGGRGEDECAHIFPRCRPSGLLLSPFSPISSFFFRQKKKAVAWHPARQEIRQYHHSRPFCQASLGRMTALADQHLILFGEYHFSYREKVEEEGPSKQAALLAREGRRRRDKEKR